MRYKVEFRYREDTGEIELLQVEVAEGSTHRAADHDAQHDRVASEIASVLQPDAQIEELGPTRAVPAADVPAGRAVTEAAPRPDELPRQVS